MGVSNLMKFLKSQKIKLPKSNMSILCNKKIAIDMYQLIYRFLHNPRKHFMTSMVCFIIYLSEYNIYPVFVIDGKPPKEKSNILRKRKAKKTKSQDEINKYQKTLENIESNIKKCKTEEEKIELTLLKEKTEHQIKKYKKRTVKVTKKIIDDIKHLFNFMKITYIHIEDNEADCVMAQLVKNKICYAALTNDSDLLTHECDIIIKDFDISTNSFTLIERDNILRTLGLSSKQLTDLIILNGTDYQCKRHPYDFSFIRELLIKNNDLEEILRQLHFGLNEYETVNNIYTRMFMKNELESNIVNYNYINTFDKSIKKSDIDMFYLLLKIKYNFNDNDFNSFKYNFGQFMKNNIPPIPSF